MAADKTPPGNRRGFCVVGPPGIPGKVIPLGNLGTDAPDGWSLQKAVR